MTTLHNQKGQTLVIMIFVILLALGVGVSISSRFITSLRSLITSSESNQAVAVAEAGLERFLNKSVSELEDYIIYDDCDDDCVITLVGDDGVTQTATISLSYLANSSEIYTFRIEENGVEEVDLDGYTDYAPLHVCWNGGTASDAPAIYAAHIHRASGSYQTTPYAYNSSGYSHSNGFPSASGAFGYDSCFTINGVQLPRMLRIRAFYNAVDLAIIPDASSILPAQGVLIESVGEVQGVRRKVSAIKRGNVLPPVFDYVIFSQSETYPLSN